MINSLNTHNIFQVYLPCRYMFCFHFAWNVFVWIFANIVDLDHTPITFTIFSFSFIVLYGILLYIVFLSPVATVKNYHKLGGLM